ncbi:MAG TPA: FtsH protease activity modulator HflK [Candidatus Limiplasma sp.]|nr:FtsH protease activity modulator HflK [Candidatus Limiplasma sp.]HRX09312.1 FtsH protease activity modulator HflK [Candidatus Limiplasma sp.]
MRKAPKPGVVIAIVIVVIVLIVAATGFYRVGQGEQALVITFGRVTDQNGPGLYWHLPYIQQIISESVTTIHTVEYGFRTTRSGSAGRAAQYSDETDESVMLTNDNSIVSIEAIYQYTIRDVKEYHFDIDDPEGTLQIAFEAVIRRNIQNRPLDDALLNKEEIELQVLPDFQALIDTYAMGVKINDVRIQNISVPQEVSAAYEDVNNAKNEKTKRLDEAERYENEILPDARSTAYETVKQAEAYKAELLAKAKSDTAVFDAVLTEYKLAPEVTRKRLLIETLENILTGSGRIIVADNASDVIKILDLDEAQADKASSVSAVEGGGN